MIAGHELPASGDIILGGTNITDDVPELALFPHLSAIDNVAFSLKMAGMNKAARHAKAREMLRPWMTLPPVCLRSSPAVSSSAWRSRAP